MRRKTREAWAAIVAEGQATGESYAATARRHGVSTQTVASWTRRLRQETDHGFAEVMLAESASESVVQSERPLLRVVLGDLYIEMETEPDTLWLAALAHAWRVQC